MAERPNETMKSGTITRTAHIQTIALGTDDEVPIFINGPTPVRITAVGIVPDAAVTGNTTNNLILQAFNRGVAGAGTTAVTAAKTYATGVDLVKNDLDALVMATTVADRDLAAGEVLELVKTETGSGLPMPTSLVVVEFQYR